MTAIVVRILILVGIGFLVIPLSKQGIQLFFANLKNKVAFGRHESRIITLENLSKNIVTVVIVGIIALMILNELGISILPIITGAGIAGLGFSLGAQSLIKDVISGFFIIFENQYNLDDLIKIGEIEGKVYKLTFRTTVLKDEEGSLIHIPNSEIKTVIVLQKK